MIVVELSGHVGSCQDIGIEFLSPALALPRFAPGTAFRMMVGESFIADGRVVQTLPASPQA